MKVLASQVKTHKLKCQIESECFYQFLEEYKPIQTSYIDWIVDRAHADDEDANLRGLLEKDYLVLGALTVLNESMTDIGGFLTDDATKIARKNNNIQLLYDSIKTQRESCESKMADYDGGRRDFYDPKAWDDSMKLLSKIAEFNDFDDVEDEIEEKLGDDIFAYSEKNGLTSEIVNSLTRNTSWKEYLTCERVLYVQIEKVGGQKQLLPKLCDAQTCIGKASNIRPTEEIVKYCENYEQLKSCLVNYYATVRSVDDGGRYKDDEYTEEVIEDLRENVQRGRALQE